MNFWQQLKKPILVMAPMEDVTDVAFRETFAQFSKLEFVYFTEFTSADGLLLAKPDGKAKVACRLAKTKNQRPIVAQIFSANPENIAQAIKNEILPRDFNGVDINMGCPDKTIIKQKAGSALIKDPKTAAQMISAAKQVSGGKIAVSVKTRIGFEKIDLNWIAHLLTQKPDALTIHLRTVKELSKVPAHWELMPDIVKLKNMISPQTILIGNGDIKSYKQALDYAKEFQIDGVMIGRGLFGRPDFFSPNSSTSKDEKIKQLITHLEFFIKILPTNCKSYHSMKKHFKAYISGFKGAASLRAKLMQTKTPEEALKILLESVNIPIWNKFIRYTKNTVHKLLNK